MVLIKTTPSVKTVLRPRTEVIGTMIKAIESENVQYSGAKELAAILTNRFNVEVTENDIINCFQPEICELESELLYKLYGF